MSEQKPTPDNKIAVLIDLENVGVAPLQSLFDRLSNKGKIVLKKAYADWGKANNNRDQILKYGIEPVHVFRSPTGRKNTSDIKLTIDAIELLHTSAIDTFVIVSSDSDFVPLVNKLRSTGKIVYVAGDDTKAKDTLKIACNEYFDIENNKSAQSSSLKAGKTAEPNAKPPETKSKLQTVTKPRIEDTLGQQIDQAWSKRASTSGQSIPGPNATSDAVKILNIQNLKSSVYKTIQGMLDASPLLTNNWSRNINTIVRK